MNTILLETYVNIVNFRNMSLAAERMYTSQATVSYRLKQLERELGVTLVNRGKGMSEVTLTHYGEEFYGLARNYLKLVNNMAFLKTSAGRYRLNIDGLQGNNGTVLRPLYSEIVQKRPELYMYIYTDHSTQVIERVAGLVADIGFAGYIGRHTAVKFEQLYAEKLLLICRRDSGYYEGIPASKLDTRFEVFSFLSTEYENWHNNVFGVKTMSMVTVRTGGSMLFDMFFRPEVWSIVPYALANMMIKSSEYDLVIYNVDPEPPASLCYKVLPECNQQHIQGLAIFQDELYAYLDELKKTGFYS